MDDLSKLSKKELIDRLQNQPVAVPSSSESYESEMAKVDRFSQAGNPHGIPLRETCDHKNIMLYTAINKRVGPLHPDNARRTMERWRKSGVQLYTAPRTPEQLEAFKQTDEYKEHIAKHEAQRKLRHQQSSKGRTEKMIEDVARATAVAVAGARK